MLKGSILKFQGRVRVPVIVPVFVRVFVFVFVIVSCRSEDNTPIHNYSVNDTQAWARADSSYAEQFRTLWLATNCNYASWDIESLDWDHVYDVYIEKFRLLDDKRKKGVEISDDTIKTLYTEILSPLHDGHLSFQIKNLATGHYVHVYPSDIRNKATRNDYNTFVPFQMDNGDGIAQLSDYDVQSYQYVNTNGITYYLSCVDTTVCIMQDSLKRLEEGTMQHAYLEKGLLDMTALKERLLYLQHTGNEDYRAQSAINSIYNRYSGMYPDFPLKRAPYTSTGEVALTQSFYMASGVINNSVPYLHFNAFQLSEFLEGSINSDYCRFYYDRVKSAWDNWFQAIQQLSAAGSLRGVIIDVRNNSGGQTSDFQYVMGALLGEERYVAGTAREKSGTGRYDYAPLVPLQYRCLKAEHVAVTDVPIVVITNCNTTSMAETTAVVAKQLSNGHVVGRASWGAASFLTSPSSYSLVNYAGTFGVKNVTPVYGYIPFMQANFSGLGVIEGIGVIPDEDVAFDHQAYRQSHRDTQLSAALNHILGQ